MVVAMSGVCYFILIKKPINFQFLKDFLILNYGDVLLPKHSEREFLQTYSDKYIEFELKKLFILSQSPREATSG